VQWHSSGTGWLSQHSVHTCPMLRCLRYPCVTVRPATVSRQADSTGTTLASSSHFWVAGWPNTQLGVVLFVTRLATLWGVASGKGAVKCSFRRTKVCLRTAPWMCVERGVESLSPGPSPVKTGASVEKNSRCPVPRLLAHRNVPAEGYVADGPAAKNNRSTVAWKHCSCCADTAKLYL
jgi:hypothetical protein